MRPQRRAAAAAAALAAAVLAGVWFAGPLRAPGASLSGGPRASAIAPAWAEPIEKDVAARELEAREPVQSAPAGTTPSAAARRAVAGLSARLDPATFRPAEFESLARALASELGPDAQRELLLLAADARLAASGRVACAELLRHLAASSLPEPALASVREVWAGRERDPVLASAAVRALGAFGSAADRSALLELSLEGSQPQFASLALAGLSAARGDEAALELVAAAQLATDARRADLGLAALCSIAASASSGLSPWVRAQCADAIEHTLTGPQATGASRPRKLCALAALDPARSAPR